jgi:uncharacterized BrkB/YihY/UPF0761 family membrane protein
MALLSAAFGLVAGVAALVASQKHAHRISNGRSAMAVRITSSETLLGFYYVVVFIALVAISFLGSCLAQKVLTHV